jgi:tRNA(fMet)-specific endonuclease VapC
MGVDGYLLDTNTVRYYFDRHVNVIAKIDSLADEIGLYISVVTRGEIEFGHCITHSTNTQRRDEYDQFVKEKFVGRFIIPVTTATGLYYGDLKAKLFTKHPPKGRKENHPECCIDQVTGFELGIDENDLWIAAQAIEHNLILVTNDKLKKIKSVAEMLLADAEDWTKPI